jgi:hypothetical protein
MIFHLSSVGAFYSKEESMAAKKPRYTFNDKPVQSVTEVLSMLAKPLLLPWGVKLTAAAFKQLIKDHGYTVSGDDELDAIEQESKKAYRKASEEAMGTGTAVHDAIEQYVAGNAFIQQIPDGPVKRGLNAFIAWGETVDLDIHSQEQTIYGYVNGNSQPLYAGKYDMLAHLNGVLTMCDFKVAKDIYPEYWIQLNAYARAMQPELKEQITQVAILRIDKETGTLYPEFQPIDIKKQEIFIKLAEARKLMKEAE